MTSPADQREPPGEPRDRDRLIPSRRDAFTGSLAILLIALAYHAAMFFFYDPPKRDLAWWPAITQLF